MNTRYGLPNPVPTGRMGWLVGMVLVEFRLNTTDELLWEAAMLSPPETDDVVPCGVGTGELTDYTVVSLRREFRKTVIPGTVEDPGEVEVEGSLCFCTYIVIVKEGL